jgi:V/A-type H+-transporting ATPase subunit K
MECDCKACAFYYRIAEYFFKEIKIMETGLIALGAGLAIGISAIATSYAQSRIGAAGIGALAEHPELVGTVIILVAIPETMVILGFAAAAMMIMQGGG